MSPEGWICPWCQVCSTFANDHLWTSDCRDQVQQRGLTPGPFLRSLLDNRHVLPQLTEDQLQMLPSMILPCDERPAKPVIAVPTVAQGGAHNVANPLPLATAVPMDQFLADESRQYRCANPRCHPTGPFLINSNPRSGGYCCKNCFDHHVSGKKGKVTHGPFCKQIPAPGSALQAPPIAAESLRNSAPHQDKKHLL